MSSASAWSWRGPPDCPHRIYTKSAIGSMRTSISFCPSPHRPGLRKRGYRGYSALMDRLNRCLCGFSLISFASAPGFFLQDNRENTEKLEDIIERVHLANDTKELIAVTCEYFSVSGLNDPHNIGFTLIFLGLGLGLLAPGRALGLGLFPRHQWVRLCLLLPGMGALIPVLLAVLVVLYDIERTLSGTC